MNADEKIALGERMVKCAGFRWIAGMLCLPGKGTSEGGRYLGDEDDGYGNVGYRDGTCAFKVNSWLPDMSDPCTLGGVLALVREAWGDADMSAVKAIRGAGIPGTAPPHGATVGDDGGWGLYRWGVCRDGSVLSVAGWRSTEAEALVAALEAAPHA